jgi:hypothetical protein
MTDSGKLAEVVVVDLGVVTGVVALPIVMLL